MREDEVYVGTKIWFKAKGFAPLAGQPPNGCDNIPTIEIKEINNRDKGSKGSFKPDLVFGNPDYLVLVECKPLDDKQDEIKLLEVLTNKDRQRLLYEEIVQRGIFKRRKLEEHFSSFEKFSSKLRACLSHGGETRLMEKVMTVSLVSMSGQGTLTQPNNENYKINC
jgi:hypothetical protein